MTKLDYRATLQDEFLVSTASNKNGCFLSFHSSYLRFWLHNDLVSLRICSLLGHNVHVLAAQLAQHIFLIT